MDDLWTTDDWQGAKRLWLGEETGRQIRLFRREIELADAPTSAQLHIFAEMRWHAWVNGDYQGRGTILRHPNQLVIQSLDVTEALRTGTNVLAIQVLSMDQAVHNGIPLGHPGVIALLELTHADGQVEKIISDESWRATDQTGWHANGPKRGWALDCCEIYTSADGQQGWEENGFDDSAWCSADVMPPFETVVMGGVYRRSPIPDLVYNQVTGKVMGVYATLGQAPAFDESVKAGEAAWAMFEEPWRKLDGEMEALTVPEDGTGVAVVIDLGENMTGQVIASFETSAPATVDIGWSEIEAGGRPVLRRKGVGYVDRIISEGGVVHWQPIQYTAGRYVTLIAHTTGTVKVQFLGMRESHPDLPWVGDFQSDDELANAIWAMSERTLRVGTQEGMMDCPTREQAAYIGDGHPCARWLAMLTGDTRHWTYLVREQFRRSYADGLVRTAIFTGGESVLIDYNLLAIIGSRDYCRYTGTKEMAGEVLGSCRRILSWFDSQKGADGLFSLEWQDMPGDASAERIYDSERPSFPRGLNLFIDHPGLGWHNREEPGIDRRGINGAINMLLIVALRAMADLEVIAGNQVEARRRQEEADLLATTVRERFWATDEGCFVDGIFEGEPLAQRSEQTNTWGIWAGCCDDDEARTIIRKLAFGDHTDVAWCGPYFHSYMFTEMARLGMISEALELMKSRWKQMLDGGASTLWETFLGDDLDSWCHPWSAPTVELLLVHVLGLPADGMAPMLKPRYDLLTTASGCLMRTRGPWRISWAREGSMLVLSGSLPEGISAAVQAPDGSPLGKVEGIWRLEVGPGKSTLCSVTTFDNLDLGELL